LKINILVEFGFVSFKSSFILQVDSDESFSDLMQLSAEHVPSQPQTGNKKTQPPLRLEQAPQRSRVGGKAPGACRDVFNSFG
jgi:hypothetical protein